MSRAARASSSRRSVRDARPDLALGGVEHADRDDEEQHDLEAHAVALVEVGFGCPIEECRDLLFPLIDCIFIDAPLYLFTARLNVPVYLNGSQQLDIIGGHAIEGCDHLPCSDRDSIYYLTENTLFNNLWSLAHGRGFYFPEYIGAAVPYQTTKCFISYYRFRFRFTSHLLNLYPHLLAVSCVL